MGHPFLHRSIFILYVHTRLPKTERILSIIALEAVFTDELGLDLVLNYYSTRDFLNSRPINLDPWTYVIFVGQGHLIIHIVSIMFMMIITHFSSYYIILNHLVTGLVVVVDFRILMYDVGTY